MQYLSINPFYHVFIPEENIVRILRPEEAVSLVPEEANQLLRVTQMLYHQHLKTGPVFSLVKPFLILVYTNSSYNFWDSMPAF